MGFYLWVLSAGSTIVGFTQRMMLLSLCWSHGAKRESGAAQVQG